MFDPKDLLGMMLGTGMGGHNSRLGGAGSLGGVGGPAASGMGGLGALLEGFGGGSAPADAGTMAASSGATGQQGLGRMGKFASGAGIAVLGALALNAYERYRQSQADAAAGPQGDAPQAASGGGAEQVDDGEAVLLIRAMVAAANADGRIDAEEERNILGRLERAGAIAEQRDFLQRELRNPAALETLLRDVRGPQMAERFYAASALAIKADTDAERSYLRYLADRLSLKPQESNDLLQRLGFGSPVA
jgi:uncharacterized membrane protein YebE (DUF533 family)